MRKNIDGEYLTLEETLIKNENLVHHICHSLANTGKALGLDYDDLVSVGQLGLIHAYNHFKPELNLKFSTFAFPSIRFHIITEINAQTPGVKFSREAIKYSRLMLKDGLETAPKEVIAKTYGISLKRVEEAVDCLISRFPDSIEAKVENKDGESRESVFDSTFGVIDEDYEKINENDFKTYLTEVEEAIYMMRLKDYTQNQISEKLNLSQTGVSRALKTIKEKYLIYIIDTGDIDRARQISKDYNMKINLNLSKEGSTSK